MGYTTVPAKSEMNPVCDDFMADWSEPIWGPSGRNDLQIMKDMGVHAVRTYGIGSHLNHSAFLDHAHDVGLKVLPGFADWPYMQSGSSCGMERIDELLSNCINENNYDCHDVIRQHYGRMLAHGYTVVGEDGQRRYHPALQIITLINECELKLQYGQGQELGLNANHAKVVVSALDGLLSAEDDLQIVGPGPLLTATASYAACPSCKSVQQSAFPSLTGNIPFLAFVADHFLAITDPVGFVGYTPKHDLMEVYQSRWINSFNTANHFVELCEQAQQVVKLYNAGPLGKIPIYIGEFHAPYDTPEEFGQDVVDVMRAIENEEGNMCQGEPDTPQSLIGFNAFEFQVSYWKGAHSEGESGTKYGFWGLGDASLAKTHADEASIGSDEFDVWCMFPALTGGTQPAPGQSTNAQTLINALGGNWPTQPALCDGYTSSAVLA